MRFRFVPILFVLFCIQLGLWLTLREIFALRRRGSLALAALQAVLAAFFVAFMLESRNGLQMPAMLRFTLIEPMLALVTLSTPLMLLLGLALSAARRLPGGYSESRRAVMAGAAKAVIGGTFAAVAFGVEQAELQPLLTRHEVPIRGLHQDLDGLTLVQLSDIHAGALMTEERMLRIARAANALNPDLVVLTGDLLDVSPLAARPFSRAFRELKPRLGAFAVLGNHDYFAGFPAVERAVRDANATLLRNSGVRIERGRGSLFLGGVDDPSHGSLGPHPARALKAAAPEEPRIVLAHRPSLFEDCAAQGAQLVLSGHTHGGQIALSPAWSLARVLGPYTMGLYRRGDSTLYVHRGMGTVGPMPVRLGSPPEIALIVLRAV
ncbi:MAG TPA: metallophosphoesterase [Myxococcales bacterium]|nr:metallophosphoesterase [Myxococcales bacterium]